MKKRDMKQILEKQLPYPQVSPRAESRFDRVLSALPEKDRAAEAASVSRETGSQVEIQVEASRKERGHALLRWAAVCAAVFVFLAACVFWAAPGLMGSAPSTEPGSAGTPGVPDASEMTEMPDASAVPGEVLTTRPVGVGETVSTPGGHGSDHGAGNGQCDHTQAHCSDPDNCPYHHDSAHCGDPENCPYHQSGAGSNGTGAGNGNGYGAGNGQCDHTQAHCSDPDNCPYHHDSAHCGDPENCPYHPSGAGSNGTGAGNNGNGAGNGYGAGNSAAGSSGSASTAGASGSGHHGEAHHGADH